MHLMFKSWNSSLAFGLSSYILDIKIGSPPYCCSVKKIYYVLYIRKAFEILIAFSKGSVDVLDKLTLRYSLSS